MELTILYRPVGQREYDLIAGAGFRSFPPRLPEEPFFEPVTTESDATRRARDWHTNDAASGRTGYVLRFQVDTEYLSQYPVRTVGSATHQEYWIPAGELAEFNRRVVGKIEVVACYRGR